LIKLTINNNQIEVEDGTTVAAAILLSGVAVFRPSVSGESRGPLCGMGICFECRVTIDGIAHQRSCTILAADGMEDVTDE
jgi:predicted molibdopterin-dependent oxidoreductase YjgC